MFVPARNNYTIEGETQIAAGTSMTSQTQTASGEDPAFFYPNEFTVEYVEDGPNTISFEESFFDNDDIAEDENFAGSEFRMTIRRARLPGNLLEDAPRRGLPGTVADITEVNAHVFEDQQSSGTAVEVAEADVSEAAMIEIRDADGNVLGSTDISEGQNTNVAVALDEQIEESQNLTSVIVDTDGSEFSEGPSSQTASVEYVSGAGEPIFLLQNLQPASATVEPGATIDAISADVTNRGGAGEQTIELLLGDTVLDSQTVELENGESTTVSFEDVTAPEEAGEYTHAIAGADQTVSGTLTVEEPGEADFQVDASVDPSSVAPEGSATVTGTVTNDGDVEGTQTVTITFNGEEVASEEVTLGSGDSQDITADVTAPSETGDVDATVESDDSSATATLTVEEEDDSSSSSDDSNGPGFGIAAALVALLGAALLAYRRQN